MKIDGVARALSVVACLALARPAAAQSADPPPLPPAAPAAPAAAPADAPASTAPAGPAASTAPAPGRVRVHLRTLREKKAHVARLYIKNDGKYSVVCVSPCTSELPVNSELRVTFDDVEDEPHTFVLGPEVGSDVEIEVRPASKAPVIGGAVMMGSGGLLALFGLYYLAQAADEPKDDGFLTVNREEVYRKVGYIFLGLGAATSVTGLIWFLTKDNEPRITKTPLEAPRPQAYNRLTTVLGDAAFAKPRDATSVLGVSAPVTPLGWSVAF